MIFGAKKSVCDRYPGRRYLPNTSEYDSGGGTFFIFSAQYSTSTVLGNSRSGSVFQRLCEMPYLFSGAVGQTVMD